MKLTVLLAVALMAGAANAQTDTKARTDRSTGVRVEGKTQLETTSSQYRGSKLLGTKVKTSQGEDVGELEDLVLDPRSGEVQFAVLGLGGVLGIGEKKAPIPWKALNVTGEKQITINVDKSKLETGPRLAKEDWNNLQSRELMQRIHSHYGMEVPSASGSTGSGAVTIGVGTEKDKDGKSFKIDAKKDNEKKDKDQ